MMLFNSVMKFLVMSYSKFRKDFRRAAMVSVFLPMALLSAACMGDKPADQPVQNPTAVEATVEVEAAHVPFEKRELPSDTLVTVEFDEHANLDEPLEKYPFLADIINDLKTMDAENEGGRASSVRTAHYVSDNHEIVFTYLYSPMLCTASGCATEIHVKKSGEDTFKPAGSGIFHGSVTVSEHNKDLSIYYCSFGKEVQQKLVGDTFQVQQMVSTPPSKPFTCNM